MKDSLGGQGQARVHVTTTQAAAATVLFFISNPSTINAGQQSQLQWSTQNATTVTISGVGTVNPSGSVPVSPSVTTTYQLTASNATSTQTASATVIVTPAAAQVSFCTATPMNITAGEASTITFQTINATSVSVVPSVGAVGLSGTFTVSPTTSTNYVITATGANGSTNSCSVAVNVTPGTVPQIITFAATPATINQGQSSTLTWNVQNATSVSISPTLGSVSVAGSQAVTPTATTVYTLTATNAAGTSTATTTVNVVVSAPPIITSFTATPNPSPAPATAVLLNCQTQGASSVTMAGILFLPGTSEYYEHPTQNTTYTCIATGPGGQTATQSVTVTVLMPVVPPSTTPPTIVILGGPNFDRAGAAVRVPPPGFDHHQSGRVRNTYSPVGNNPLTFAWTTSSSAVSISGATTSKPTITLSAPGIYTATLTVTDSKGNTTSQIVILDWAFNKP